MPLVELVQHKLKAGMPEVGSRSSYWGLWLKIESPGTRLSSSLDSRLVRGAITSVSSLMLVIYNIQRSPPGDLSRASGSPTSKFMR